MAVEVFKKCLRGKIVDLVQHQDWILMAARHSEGHNLGIQAMLFREGRSDVLKVIECPSIVKSLAALSPA